MTSIKYRLFLEGKKPLIKNPKGAFFAFTSHKIPPFLKPGMEIELVGTPEIKIPETEEESLFIWKDFEQVMLVDVIISESELDSEGFIHQETLETMCCNGWNFE